MKVYPNYNILLPEDILKKEYKTQSLM